MSTLDYDQIKRLVIIAMFSDDDLMDLLVLKGGNALDIIYEMAQRASIDVDFSIEGEFDDLETVAGKIRRTLEETFSATGHQVFDVKLTERPPTVSANMQDFWGGYRAQFKLIEREKYRALAADPAALRRNATVVGDRQRRTFWVDISKFEHCRPKQASDFEGYTIYVYTPEMLVFEKLRAICQQMPEYGELVKSSSRSARARDFFDIYTVDQARAIDFGAAESLALVRDMFQAKRVPLRLIGRIGEYREYHRPDFLVVRDTVKAGVALKDFDFYFDYVVEKCRALKPLWDE
ncbi:MAG TPA: nucleotidyl transferase AbiEii/AbiGii toxin family protein [Phycisphaerae bacterium]|nr:nucleotidyl transferase AbiEii/AbiGii toxin family protein [Phycisphaerae bacterium]